MAGVSRAESSSHAVFLIQDAWGSIIGIPMDAEGHASEPVIVRPVMSTPLAPGIIDLAAYPDGGYQLFGNGVILPIGGVRPSFTPWVLTENAVAFCVLPNGSGGWIATPHYLKTIGNPPPLILPSIDGRLADVEWDAPNNRLVLLFTNGPIVLCRSTSPEWIKSLELSMDEAIDVEIDGNGIGDGFYVQTYGSHVYRVTADRSEEEEGVPDLGSGLSRDLESSPFGEGFYILDAFGVIHACGGAPVVPTEPFRVDTAMDLEIISGAVAPRWYPEGWNTAVELIPHEIRMDPGGSPKTLSLFVHDADDMASFGVEIRYDPAQLVILPAGSVTPGAWWERHVRNAQVHAQVDPRQKGVITLYGGGTFSLYEGASGNGELLKIAAAPAPGVTAGTTVIQVQNFFFQDATPLNRINPGKVLNTATVWIHPSLPKLSLAWYGESGPLETHRIESRLVDLLRVDLLVEEGSRISTIAFDLHFDPDVLRFLGMMAGDAWSRDAEVWPHFATPSEGNRLGELKDQRIESSSSSACRDEKSSLATLWFSSLKKGETSVRLDAIRAADAGHEALEVQVQTSEIQAIIQ